MEPLYNFYCALIGFFAFAAIYHSILWSSSGRKALLAVFSIDCVLLATLSGVVLTLISAQTRESAENALWARMSLALFLQATWLWSMSLVSGVQTRWFVWPVIAMFLFGFAVHTFVYPLNSRVLSVDQIITPWGEIVASLQLGPMHWWYVLVLVLLLANSLFGLACGLQIWQRDRIIGTLIVLISCAFTLNNFGLEILRHFPRFNYPIFGGLIIQVLWVCVIAILIARDNRQSLELSAVNEQRFRLLFEGARDAIFLADAETGLLIDCNLAAENLLGRERAEIIGQPQTFLHPPDVAAQNRETFRAHATSAVTTNIEQEVLRKDGRKVAVSIAPAVTTIGRQKVIQGIFRDITEQRKANEALEMMRFCVDHAGDSMFWVSRAGKILYVNDTACAERGYSRDELLRMSIFDLDVEPEYQFSGWETHFEQLKSCGTITLESRHRTKGGRVFPIEVNANYVHIGSEEFNFATVRDITERKLVEQSLRESELRYRSLVDHAPVGMYVNLKNRFAFVNEAMCHLVGANSKDELLGQSVLDRFPPEILPEILARIERVTVHGETVPLLGHRYIRLNRSHIDVETLAIPIQFDGQPATQVVIIDVTERKRSEERLRATERRLATIFRSCPVGMCITTLEDGTVLELNEMCCKIGRCSREDVLGRSANELGYWLAPDERRNLVQNLMTHGSVASDEFSFRRKDGTIGHTLRSLERFAFEGQDCILSMFLDISDRKQIEEELRTSHQRLEVLSRQLITTQEAERRHLARELHDEIGQILTVIKMSLNRTQREADASLLSHLEHNVAMVDQAIVQVRNLALTLRPPQLDELGLGAALHGLLSQQARLGEFEGQIDVILGDVQIASELEIVCFRITQEALTNAIRYAKPSKVQVKLWENDNKLHLTIKDDGCGFDLDAAMKRASIGKSLGLISMQERAKLACGQIKIETNPGDGTSIHASFPL